MLSVIFIIKKAFWIIPEKNWNFIPLEKALEGQVQINYKKALCIMEQA